MAHDDASLDPGEAAALTAALVSMALCPPDGAPRLVPLTGGVSSTIVRAETPDGPVCVKRALARLKVSADWRAPVGRNAAEVAWIRFAADVEPRAVPRILGHDRQVQAFAMEWLPPERFPVWKALLRDGAIDTQFAAEVGRRLVAIHAASASRPWLAASFDHMRDFDALRLDPYFAHAARAHPDRADALHALIDGVCHARIALMHGDISPKNILSGPHGPVFLDAECACWGDPAFDLAFCLNHLLLKGCWRPAHRGAYLACFDALSGTYLAGVDWEPAHELERRTCALLAGLLLARIDGKSPVEYIVDEGTRDRVRGFARAMLAQPDTRLAHVSRRWHFAGSA